MPHSARLAGGADDLLGSHRRAETGRDPEIKQMYWRARQDLSADAAYILIPIAGTREGRLAS